MLNTRDKKLIKANGITEETVQAQLDRFSKGFQPVTLSAPAVIGNGIQKLSEKEQDKFIRLNENSDLSRLTFVPASGAASRMFKHLLAFADSGESEPDPAVKEFFEHLSSFAFYDLLKDSLENPEKKHPQTVLRSLLTSQGLNYANLPKGLILFHKYENEIRTSVQEHIAEGLGYAVRGNRIRIHFTVSPEHQRLFRTHVHEQINRHTEKIEVSFSTQLSDTHTIAVDLSNRPFRDKHGTLLFRPSGHGALLENLNSLDTDIVFIKNIDNVVQDRLKAETIRFKKILAGVLISYQEKIFNLLHRNDQGEDVSEEGRKLLRQTGLKGDFNKEKTIDYLNRPIRVCGMVKNEGEPGGGPFWVQQSEAFSLQIVESVQIDFTDEKQKGIFQGSTHFNPVDLVCGLKNYKGDKFDLKTFRDSDTGFISEKSSDGKLLKAMELPGLWNGSMAQWNTLCVEVPLITFNPVKTVNDLLKKEHQP